MPRGVGEKAHLLSQWLDWDLTTHGLLPCCSILLPTEAALPHIRHHHYHSLFQKAELTFNMLRLLLWSGSIYFHANNTVPKFFEAGVLQVGQTASLPPSLLACLLTAFWIVWPNLNNRMKLCYELKIYLFLMVTIFFMCSMFIIEKLQVLVINT